MDILSKAPYFFGAAAGGFIVMACIGIQALVALFSSIPLAKRRHRENPAFDLKKARSRIIMVTLMVLILVGVISKSDEEETIRLPLGAAGGREPEEKCDLLGNPLSWQKCDDHAVSFRVEPHGSYLFRCGL